MAWSKTRFGRRYGRYGRYRGNMRGRAYGQRKAANAQRDTASVVINVQKAYQIPLKAGTISNAIAINIWYLLTTSPMFVAYRGMYDQIKLTGVTARIKALNASSALTLSNTPSIVTAWDRNGIDIGEPGADEASPLYFSYDVVSSYSSALLTNWSPGNSLKITRHLYPSTISEKSYYVPSVYLSVNDPVKNPSQTIASQTGQNFKPLLLLGAFTGFAAPADQSVGFMIEFDINVVFRGLRRYSVSQGQTTDQITQLAGVYYDGNTGQFQTASANENWARQNNNGDIGEYTVKLPGQAQPTSYTEVPTLPAKKP